MTETPRLSGVEAEVLRLLIQHGEMYGLQILAQSDLLKRGTIYVTLGRMADKGFVISRTVKMEHERGLPRRLFKATGLGETALRAHEAAGRVWQERFA